MSGVLEEGLSRAVQNPSAYAESVCNWEELFVPKPLPSPIARVPSPAQT